MEACDMKYIMDSWTLWHKCIQHGKITFAHSNAFSGHTARLSQSTIRPHQVLCFASHMLTVKQSDSLPLLISRNATEKTFKCNTSSEATANGDRHEFIFNKHICVLSNSRLCNALIVSNGTHFRAACKIANFGKNRENADVNIQQQNNQNWNRNLHLTQIRLRLPQSTKLTLFSFCSIRNFVPIRWQTWRTDQSPNTKKSESAHL